MSPRGRRRFLIALVAWLVLSPIAWGVYQWHAEREARSAEGVATSLTGSTSCAEWAGASTADRTGWSRQEALRRGWSARFAAGQVEERISSFCAESPEFPLAAFQGVTMTLEPAAAAPGQ